MRREQSDAEFLQGRFRYLCSAAIVLSKQQNRISKLPARSIIGKPAVGAERHHLRPSNVKCLEQAVKGSRQPYCRFSLMIVQSSFLTSVQNECETDGDSTTDSYKVVSLAGL